MKHRRRWYDKFTSWFFNTSPEWVPPGSEPSEPPAEHPGPAKHAALIDEKANGLPLDASDRKTDV